MLRSKGVATILTVLFGWVGINRVYLGQPIFGSLRGLALLLAASAGKDGGPVAALMFLLWFADIFWYSLMSEATFNRKFNGHIGISGATVDNSNQTIGQMDNRHNHGIAVGRDLHVHVDGDMKDEAGKKEVNVKLKL